MWVGNLIVIEHEKEMAERGAHQQGEGRLP
jgi:hypothetical protein